MFQKLDRPIFKEVMTNELKYIFDLFARHNFELKIAGGAVRDILMDIKPHDIDFATTATPDQMKEIFNKENIRMINTNGEKHGTITIRYHEENYEITTLRIDVTTDGRHAEVQFTNDWRLDANRRDLTINSIFLDADGTIVDYFDGYTDLKNRKVRFVGEPNKRLQEDYLRILRYFRFYGRISSDRNSFDQESIEAIRANAAGLSGIAGERIWVEFRKIVCSKFADSLMEKICDTNVHKYIGLPDKCNLEEFGRVYRQFENNLKEIPQSITMVCALLHSLKEFEMLHKRNKFSNDEKRLAEFLFAHRETKLIESDNLDNCLYPFKCILADYIKDAKAHEKITELLKYMGKVDYIKHLENWEIPNFPISGDVLSSKNVPKGPLFSKILNILKEKWKKDYNLETNQNTIDKLLNDCESLLNK